jgi:hypothetical protein
MEPFYMTKKDTGGPAFPSKKRVQRDGYLTSEYAPVGGMDLRDYFAAKALQGAIAHGLFNAQKEGADYAEFLSVIAYVYADEMIKARKA